MPVREIQNTLSVSISAAVTAFRGIFVFLPLLHQALQAVRKHRKDFGKYRMPDHGREAVLREMDRETKQAEINKIGFQEYPENYGKEKNRIRRSTAHGGIAAG